MEKSDIYALLEDKFVTYKDLLSVATLECEEGMMPLSQTGLCYQNIDKRMHQYTGDDIYVRAGLIPLLEKAQKTIESILPRHKLQIFYGYRHLDIQRNFYEMVRQDILTKSSAIPAETELLEMIHRFVAIPEVSGHPTGGAVDICILDADNVMIDMGTDRHEFSSDSYVFSPFINSTAWKNRQTLRFAMMEAGFCPFDGEWWHFSYGDREWAHFYKQKTALYSQIKYSNFDLRKEQA